jgi:membrane associated rhomboid family serine protease
VFAALGLLVAYTWRRRGQDAQRWAERVAPLVVGFALLGMLGVGGPDVEGIDLIAHLLGFMMGILMGVAVAMPRVHSVLRRVPQGLSGLITMGLLALAWVLALTM